MYMIWDWSWSVATELSGTNCNNIKLVFDFFPTGSVERTMWNNHKSRSIGYWVWNNTGQ